MVAGNDDRAADTRVFRGVVFDLDGTLLDTLTDLADCLNRVLQRHGLPTHPRDAYRMFVGDGLRMLVQRAMPVDRRDPAGIDALTAAMNAEYAEHWADQTRPYEGIPETLRALAERGLTLAVLSNKPDEFTPPAVRRFFPDIPFAAVRGARPEVPRKPDPTGALRIAAEAGLAPAEFLYLGDSGTDMQTAVRAGMHAVGVLWGFRGADELRANGAAHLLDHPCGLLTAFRFSPPLPTRPSPSSSPGEKTGRVFVPAGQGGSGGSGAPGPRRDTEAPGGGPRLPARADIRPGARVRIVQKDDQRSGRLTEGVVREVLTRSPTHPHGIKVRLETGEVGRVKELVGTGA